MLRKIEGKELHGRRYRHYALAVMNPDSTITPFPPDMLRVEECHPVRQEDVQTMLCTPDGPTAILLRRYTGRRDADWNLARWLSFGWFVVPVEDIASPLVLDIYRRKGLIQHLHQFLKALSRLCGGCEQLPAGGAYWTEAYYTFVQELNPVQVAETYYTEKVCRKQRAEARS